MIIQIVITSLMGLLILALIASPLENRLLRSVVLLSAAFGILFTWYPEASTQLANWVGVGRGADLILYIWLPVSLLAILLLFSSVHRLKTKLTQITRHLALIEAERNGSGR